MTDPPGVVREHVVEVVAIRRQVVQISEERDVVYPVLASNGVGHCERIVGEAERIVRDRTEWFEEDLCADRRSGTSRDGKVVDCQ